MTRDSPTSTVDQWGIIRGDPAQIQRQGVFDGAPSNAQRSSFSSDGRFLAIGGKRAVVVWDRQRGLSNEVPRWLGADTTLLQVTRVTYSRGDQHLLAIAFSDGTVSISEDMCELARIHAHERRITGLAFAPDGKTLATAEEAGPQVRFWDISPVLNLPAQSPKYENDAKIEPMQKSGRGALQNCLHVFLDRLALMDDRSTRKRASSSMPAGTRPSATRREQGRRSRRRRQDGIWPSSILNA